MTKPGISNLPIALQFQNGGRLNFIKTIPATSIWYVFRRKHGRGQRGINKRTDWAATPQSAAAAAAAIHRRFVQ
jgi:hypothetical protein